MTPFESAVRGSLEGSRGGRTPVHYRDQVSDRATPLSGTQLRTSKGCYTTIDIVGGRWPASTSAINRTQQARSPTQLLHSRPEPISLMRILRRLPTLREPGSGPRGLRSRREPGPTDPRRTCPPVPVSPAPKGRLRRLPGQPESQPSELVDQQRLSRRHAGSPTPELASHRHSKWPPHPRPHSLAAAVSRARRTRFPASDSMSRAVVGPATRSSPFNIAIASLQTRLFRIIETHAHRQCKRCVGLRLSRFERRYAACEADALAYIVRTAGESGKCNGLRSNLRTL